MNPIALTDVHGDATEWTNDAGTDFRFTNVAPNEWVVHRAHDHDFVARLRRNHDTYDLNTERGNPSITAITTSLSKVESLLL